MTPLLVLFILLLASHALCDYPLQGDFLARAKNHTAPLPGVPWTQALFWHAYIHAFGVLIVTGNLYAAGFELVAHIAIDYLKCGGHFGADAERAFRIDQRLHVATKALIVLARAKGLV